MVEKFQLDRHFRLWEEGNKSLNRTTFVTLAMSIALIVKVLVPFVDDSGNKKPVLEKIATLTVARDAASEKIHIIDKTAATLKSVKASIAAQPWQREKSALIERYRRMNSFSSGRGTPSRRDYQTEADQTIHRIARMVRSDVVAPLRQSVEVPDHAAELGGLRDQVTGLDQFINGWEGRYVGKQWYNTLDRKEMTMRDLGDDLNHKLNDFSKVIAKELRDVERARTAAEQQLQTLNATIVAEENKLKDIDKELQSILPSWLRGLVTAEQIIQVLPFFLTAVALYVSFVGLRLTRHYQIFAKGSGLEPAITLDPDMSSSWTLIARGRYGTPLTLAMYAAFYLLIWVMLEKSMSLLLEWISIVPSHAWVESPQFWHIYQWGSRIVLIAVLAYVCTEPWRSGDQTNLAAPKPG